MSDSSHSSGDLPQPEHSLAKLYHAQAKDLARQLHEAWVERDRVREQLAMVVFENEALIENLNRAVMLQKSAEEMSSARALEVERLKDQLAEVKATIANALSDQYNLG